MRSHFLAFVLTIWTSAASAQPVRDAGSIARDLTTATAPDTGSTITPVAPPTSRPVESAAPSDGLMIGAVRVDGLPALPRETFTTAYADYLGKPASSQDLQALAKAVASVARERGYVFATATIPRQTIDAGMVTVRLDEGNVAAVRVVGSRSARLQRTLDLIVGRGVRREVLERQLLLAGDVPGIEIFSTNLVREDIGNVLLVEVRESRGNGFAGVDNYGARDLGPVRARLRYDFIGLADADDALSVQVIATPADPRQLAYASARYAVGVGTSGTQVAITGALGRAEPSNSNFESRSTYIAVSVATPLVRANSASVWANAEIGVLRVDGKNFNIPNQRDSMATATGWLYGTTRLGNGRVSGTIGLTRGLPLRGTTASADTRASRLDANGVFTKGFFSADWVQPLGHGLALKIAANGQLADRPLLAAQEIGLGGPSFGRAFEFAERFGDSGFMGFGELRWRKSKPFEGIDWIEPYVFIDAGRVWNLGEGFGGGDLSSAGGGVRGAVGNFEVSAEVAAPLSMTRAATGDKRPRINLSLGRRF